MDLGAAVITGITVGATAVTLGSGLIAVARYGIDRWRRTIGSRHDLTRRLNELACGVTRQYVEARFGVAAFRRDLAPEKYIECVYHTPHAWLLIWYSRDDAVKVISITVTDPRFHFPVRSLTFDQLNVILNRSTFSNVSSGYEGSRLEVQARRCEYAEMYHFGNPGGYAHYILSYNDAGRGKFEYDPSHRGGLYRWAHGRLPAFRDPNEDAPTKDTLPTFRDPSEGPPAVLAAFRTATSINTLTIISPDINTREELAVITKHRIGVDLDRVRMLRT